MVSKEMRNMILEALTLGERAKLSQGQCPDCERPLGDEIRGNAVINIECPSCGIVFSMVVDFKQGALLKEFFEIAG